MLAIRFHGDGDLRCEEAPNPRVTESSLLLKIAHAGVCGTDTAILTGKVRARPGVTLGHEFCGSVVDIGDRVSGFKIGDRVFGSPSIPCLDCHYCRRGDTQLCNRFTMFGVEIDGSFAEYMLVPSAERVLVTTAIDEKVASLLGDTMATGYHAVEQAGLARGQTVAVLGAGPVGCAVLMAALAKNVKDVYIIARSRYRLDIAEKLGGTALDATQDVHRRVLQDTLFGVDAVVECAGAQVTLDLATRLVRKGGRIVVTSIMPEVNFLMQDLMINEKHVIGAFCPTGPAYLRKIQRFVEENGLQSKLAALISHEFALKNGVEAIRSLDSTERMKVLINP